MRRSSLVSQRMTRNAQSEPLRSQSILQHADPALGARASSPVAPACSRELTQLLQGGYVEAPVRIELTNSRFAVCRLTTWPRRRATKLSVPEPPEQSGREDAERQSSDGNQQEHD